MRRTVEEYGMGLVRSTSFGRKRVSLSDLRLDFGDDYDDEFRKRRCFQDSFFGADRATSSIEEFPGEILIRILCGVEHDDLRSLFFVSKAIREATLVAKKSHFAFSTPRKNLGFRRAEHLDDDTNEVEAPNAPKQSRIQRSGLSAKKLADISVNLFGSDDEVS